MMTRRMHTARIQSASRQRGAVLYVALIMLVLLALIGIVALQVAGMQERMAASYRAVNLAFQFTEERARATECGLEVLNGVPDATGCTSVARADIKTQCDDEFDAGEWTRTLPSGEPRTLASGPATNIRQIEACLIGEAEIGMGMTQEQGGGLQPVYQITTYQTDSRGGDNPTSSAAIDTVFKL
ncbi:pilus assembly PilX family protein [Luteimonas sp. JM171]|uniref:pilus assembly PilX family protein n=1 Tax=Luteimonas sp. JM171 TaxID=1896164 RepID=UPI0008570DFE|nr:PilX N-terminal domain-containing pilus assembly protein [Luteimonas sp. JM171]AOH34982.1 hypothetical protein BGP89_00245 [Luteimonas sp. JM171]